MEHAQIFDSASLLHAMNGGIVYLMEIIKGDDQNCILHKILQRALKTPVFYPYEICNSLVRYTHKNITSVLYSFMANSLVQH